MQTRKLVSARRCGGTRDRLGQHGLGGRRGRRVLFGLAGFGLVLAGCSSSSSSSTTTSTTSSTGSTGSTTANASTLVIGNVGTYSGPDSSTYGGGKPSIIAWEDYVNANGGIDGHPVKVITMDDAGSGPTSLSDVKQLVTQDHIIAMVGAQSDTDASWDTYLQQQGIPNIGGFDSVTNIANSDYFAVGTTQQYTASFPLEGAIGLGAGKNAALFYCAEAPACAQAVPLFQKGLPTLGMKLVYNTAISATAPSYTAPCLAAKQSGAGTVIVALSESVFQLVAADCLAQGYNPIYNANGTTITTEILKSKARINMVQQDTPFTYDGSPAAQTFYGTLNKYAPGLINGPLWGETDIETWLGGELFADAVKAANIGSSPTAAEVLAGLYKLNADTLGGLAPPLTFHTGKPSNVPCFFLQDVDNGKFVYPFGTAAICPPYSTLTKPHSL